MKKTEAVMLAAATIAVGFAGNALADTLPLKHVVVTASGLALYEYQGDVTGNATLDFPVRVDRVDDVLKSLVVLDGKGAPAGVSLPGREPLAQLFGGLPFTEGDLASQPQLLNALRGAEVHVSGSNGSSDGSADGRLLGVADEPVQTKDGQTLTHHRVSVATSGGLRSYLLENGTTVQFADKAVQAQLDRALAGLADYGNKSARMLHVDLRGDGTRPVGVSFLEQAPLWKATYRLVLPADIDKGGQATLQGWAILENTTGQDWHDVALTLMSGAPVTYHQALYDSYYVPQNELPLQVMGLVLPKVDNGTVAAAKLETAEADSASVAVPAPMMERQMLMKAVPMAAPAGYGAIAQPELAPTQSVPPAEAASQMIFAFPQTISLPAGNSLMAPFIGRTLSAEKLWVYQPPASDQMPPPVMRPMTRFRMPGVVGGPPAGRSDTPDHPYAAVSIRNDSPSSLPPGILTLYTKSANGLLFVGDAQMPLLPKGEDRFVSFALDTKTAIDRQAQADHALGLITIANGMLNQQVVETNTTIYTLKAPSDEPRTLVIEQPRRDGWLLQKPDGLASDVQVTSNAYRLRVALAAGQSKTIKATLTRTAVESVALASANADDLDTRMAAAGDALPAPVRAALDKVKTLQAAIAAPQKIITDNETARQSITDDQQRLRDNLKTVSPNSEIGKRYLKTLDTQENKLDALTQSDDDARRQLAAAQKALAAYVGGLTL